MSQHPTKLTSGPPTAGLFAMSDHVDASGNLWIIGTVSLSGVVLGPQPGSAALPVVIATDQAPIPIKGTIPTDITKVGGTGIMLGQTDKAHSFPVTLALDQPNVGVGLPNIAKANTPQNAVSIAYEASRLVKSTSGVLFGLSGYNSKASAQFILLFDFAGPNVPPNTTSVPVGPIITVAAASTFSVDFGYWGMAFQNGIWIANSSTGPTLTIGSADCWIAARYA